MTFTNPNRAHDDANIYICAIPRELDAQIALRAAANFSSSKNYLPRKQKEAREPRKTRRINISIGVEKKERRESHWSTRTLDYRYEIFPKQSMLIAPNAGSFVICAQINLRLSLN